MRNKFFLLIHILFLFCNEVFSEEFYFEAQSVKLIESEKKIIALNGKAINKKLNLEILGEKFEYDKIKNILIIKKNGLANFNLEKIKINFDEGVLNQNKKKIFAEENVVVESLNNDFQLETNKLIFDYEKNIINSDDKSILKDKFGNTFFTDKFSYEINKDLIKVENLKLIDTEKNILISAISFINLKSNKIFGKDVEIDLSNSQFDENNEPRIKGNSFIYNKTDTTVNKAVFSTCKKRDGCPPWQIVSEKIFHDKKKATVFYDNATLKVYDIPILYFPKFFHPDPTVKRRSGFLIPKIKSSSNSGNFLNTPYFLAISENKDATFSPRFYSDESFLIQTEYRQKNSNSDHFSDFSFFSKKSGKSKNHFFYRYSKIFDFMNFDLGKINYNLQKLSNKTYLKTEKIDSKIINDKDVLENSLNLELSSSNLSLNFETLVYENLNINNNNKYEYIYPKLSINKKIENFLNLNGNLIINSDNIMRNYNGNIYEKSNINDFIFTSNPKYSNFGFQTNYQYLIKNSNSNNKKSEIYKNGQYNYLSGIYQFNSSIPMISFDKNNKKILIPKLSMRIAPSHTKNEKDKDNKMEVDNLFDLNRSGTNDTIEGGFSASYGTEYKYFNADNSEIINFEMANNLRISENKNLQSRGQIGEKTSNFFTKTTYKPNNFIDLYYEAAIKNNLDDVAYENLSTKFELNKLVTTFDYINENDSNSKNSYLANTTSYNINESNNIQFSTRKNKTDDLTEYYKLMYQYKNDCLSASIEYNKDFYNDRDLKAEESLLFKLTLIPFGSTNSPNLKN